MSDSFSIDVTQVEHFSDEVRKVPTILQQNLLRAADKVGFAGSSIAKQYAPFWQGVLAGSIANEPAVSIVDGVSVSVATNQQHALTMEDGRKAGSKMPPREPVLAWMASKGIPEDREFIVRKAIAKHGIPGHFFMKRTLEQMAPAIIPNAFDEAIANTLAILMGGGS
jgi:hypothetical protein